MYFQYGQEETEYLSGKDEKLGAVIAQVGRVNREVDTDLFSAVVHHIVGQQISTKAQATIWQRMRGALGTVDAEHILEAGNEQLQLLGISCRKAEYITDFARKIQNGEFDLEGIWQKPDEEVIRELSALKGIGVWTAEMILLFCILSTATVLGLSKASVTSYLPYEKGVYFPNTADKGKISVGAERQRRYRAMKRWRTDPTEEHLWEVVLLYAGVRFKTYSGLPFTYEIRKGRNGQYTKELWIDRRENSKSLAWSSVLLALGHIKKVGEVVERPKALGDIRGVTYIYGMFYRFGLIDVPDEAKEKMKKAFSKSS